MGEVKYYHVSDTGLTEGTALGRITVVLAVDFATAQSELSALREELAVANHEIDSRISAEVGAIEALQAAEQRNAVITELLKSAKPYIPWGQFGSVKYQWNLEVQEALKPTESGASE